MNGILQELFAKYQMPTDLGGTRRARGFSVLELMMTLSLIAILAATAIPSYQDAVEKRRITQGAELIVAFVGTIQTESIKRNRPMTVSYNVAVDGSWCMGAVLDQAPCDCTEMDAANPGFCAIDSAAWLLRDSDVQARDLINSISGDGAFVFDPVRGMFLDPADSLLVGLQSGLQSGGNEFKFKMNLSVINTGKIALCVLDDSSNIPGFSTCG